MRVRRRYAAEVNSGCARFQRWLRAGWLLCALNAAACGSRSGSVGDAASAAQTYLPTFVRFAGWAKRAAGSDLALDGDEALKEATFAPLRADRRVLWADVNDDHGQRLTYRTPIAVDSLEFVTLGTSELGNVRVAVSEACRVMSHGQATEKPCVVLASGSAPHRSVQVAFELDAAHRAQR